MKQTLHTSRRAFKLALLCLMAFVTWGGNYCIAQETAYKTLSFPDDNRNNNKVNAYTETWTAKIGDFSWKIANFSNYNWDWTHIRAGRKKDASVATIGNTTPFDKAIGKIVVDIAKIEESKITKINSIKFEVSSDGFQTIDQTNTITSDFNNVEKHTFVVSNPRVGQYFRLTFDMKAGGKNGFVQINKVEYYEDASNKTATSLSFDASSYEISKGLTLQQLPTLKAGEQTLSGKTITWSSDNENVATVDENGTVTGVAAGKANITAKFAGDDTYKTSKASYEIIVKGAPTLSFPETSYTIEVGDAFTAPKLEGLPKDVTPAYTSSNEEVATVNTATGEVKIVGVGTTTITVTSPNTDIYKEATASYELTVKLATSKEVTFDYSLADCDDTNGTVTLTYDKGGSTNPPKWYSDKSKGNGKRFYAKNKLTITAKNRIRNIQFVCVPADNDKIYDITTKNTKLSAGVYNDENKTWDLSGVNEKVVTFESNLSSGHFRIQKIIVTTELPTSVGTISIATSEGFGTYYNSNSYILPEGLTAFGYKEANTDGTLVKTEEFTGGDVVPANAALVVKGNTGKYECYATDKEATKTLEGNLLKGVTTDTKIEAKSGVKRYILTRADDGILAFYRTNTGNINVKANRAYLEVPTAMAVASFSLEGSATGINNVVTTAAKQGIYTISGVRLNATTTKELPAGIYIVDGKKVIVK